MQAKSQSGNATAATTTKDSEKSDPFKYTVPVDWNLTGINEWEMVGVVPKEPDPKYYLFADIMLTKNEWAFTHFKRVPITTRYKDTIYPETVRGVTVKLADSKQAAQASQPQSIMMLEDDWLDYCYRPDNGFSKLESATGSTLQFNAFLALTGDATVCVVAKKGSASQSSQFREWLLKSNADAKTCNSPPDPPTILNGSTKWKKTEQTTVIYSALCSRYVRAIDHPSVKDKHADVKSTYHCVQRKYLDEFVSFGAEDPEVIFLSTETFKSLENGTYPWDECNGRIASRTPDLKFLWLEPYDRSREKVRDKNVWQNIRDKLVKSREVTKAKPPRYSNPSGLTLYFLYNGGRVTFEVFKSLVVKVARDAGAAIGQKFDVVDDLTKLPKEYSYYRIGASPFGDYDTYISMDDMIGYLKGGRGDRQLPSKRNEPFEGLVQRFAERGYDGTTFSFVSRKKVLDAVGTRNRAGGQKKPMENTSATDIANALWFPDKAAEPRVPPFTAGTVMWPAGFTPAEWLHKQAYSFGGFGGLNDVVNLDTLKSSQLRRNLIFGTSETNSYMTRYEKAFQDLLVKEAELAPQVFGQLKTKTNITGLPLTRLDINANGQVVNVPVEEELFLRRLTSSCPPMAFNLLYGFKLHCTTSLILGNVHIFLQVFYPFGRPIYTKLEHLIDEAFLDYLYKIAKNGCYVDNAGNKFHRNQPLEEEVPFPEGTPDKKLVVTNRKPRGDPMNIEKQGDSNSQGS